MFPNTVHVTWSNPSDPKPVAISVLYREWLPEHGVHAYGIMNMVDGNTLPPNAEWLPLGIFEHSLYVDDNEEAVTLLNRRTTK